MSKLWIVRRIGARCRCMFHRGAIGGTHRHMNDYAVAAPSADAALTRVLLRLKAKGTPAWQDDRLFAFPAPRNVLELEPEETREADSALRGMQAGAFASLTVNRPDAPVRPYGWEPGKPPKAKTAMERVLGNR